MVSMISIQTPTSSFFGQSDDDNYLLSIMQPLQVINVIDKGAKGDGVTDDTAAIQAALADAAALGRPCIVYFGNLEFMVQDVDTSEHALSTDGPIRVASDMITLLGDGAVIKIGPNGVSTAAIRCFGDWPTVRGIKVNCNAARTAANHVEGVHALRTKGNSGIEFNGAEGFLCTDCIVFGGDKGDANADDEDTSLGPMGGEDSYVSTNSDNGLFRRCVSLDAAWTAFKIGNSNGCRYEACVLQNMRGHGIRVQGQIETIYIDKCNIKSNRNSGRCGIIIDPASGGSSTNRCENAWITYCDVYTDPTTDFGGGSSNCLKLASCRNCVVTGGYYSSNDGSHAVTIRLEDALTKVLFREVKIIGEVSYAPRSGDMAEGQCVNSHTNSGGFSTIDLGVSNISVGKSIYIQGSNNRNLNREHIVTAKPGATTYTLNTPYIAGTMGTNAWFHTCVNDSRYIDCEFINPKGVGGTYCMTKVFSRTFVIQGGSMKQPNASTGKMSMIEWDMARDENLKFMRVVNVDVEFFSDKLCKFIRPSDSGTTEVQTLTFASSMSATTGTFTLTHNGNASGAITFSTTTATLAANIQTALRAVTALGSVTAVYTSGTFGSTNVVITVTFYGVPGNTVQLTANTGGLSGGSPSITPATTTQGVISKQLLTAGKVICYGNRLSNNDSGSMLVVDTNDSNEAAAYPGRGILFANDGERLDAYLSSAAPTMVDVPWPKGSIFRNTDPDVGEPSHWICTTAGVRDTSVGTFSSSGNLA